MRTAEVHALRDAGNGGVPARRAGRGCQIRILLLSPDSPFTEVIDRDEGHPPGTLTTRVAAALGRFGQMRRGCGNRMRIRVYDEYPTVSVVRGDDAMLVTPYLRFLHRQQLTHVRVPRRPRPENVHPLRPAFRELATMTDAPQAGTMQDARLIETEILLPKPKRFVREALVMPDGYECDWYYVDTPPSVMVVPVTADGQLVLVRQYRHNLKSYQLEFPAGTMNETEDPEHAARRELEEETGYTAAEGVRLRPLGSFYSLPSETNKYTHVYLASPVTPAGPARLDTEIEKYFDISVVLLPVAQALGGIGTVITSMETVGALMAARTELQP